MHHISFSKLIIVICPDSPGRSDVIVTVFNSRPFLTWILSLGPGAKIVSPPHVVSAMQSLLPNAAEQYDVLPGRAES